MKLVFITALSTLCLVSAQVFMLGECPDVKLAENFEPAKYFNGKWYEQKRFFAEFEAGLKCVNAQYTPLEGGRVAVNNSGTSIANGTISSQTGEAFCMDKPTSSCKVRFFPGTPFADYNIVSADPEKYGLVFSCRQIIPGCLNSQVAFILTRDKVVKAEDMRFYLSVFEKNGVDTRHFMDTLQDCPSN